MRIITASFPRKLFLWYLPGGGVCKICEKAAFRSRLGVVDVRLVAIFGRCTLLTGAILIFWLTGAIFDGICDIGVGRRDPKCDEFGPNCGIGGACMTC